MNTLESLRIFLRVAQTCSFTKAAADLGINKSRISIVIRELEAGLGTRLLHRTTRSVTLTEDGNLFYAQAKEIVASVEALKTLFADEADLRGKLRVDLPTDLANTTIIPNLPAFLARYPGLGVELSCSDRRVDLVQEGVDCVVRAGSINDTSLVATRLGRLPMFNLASPAYLQRKGRPETVQDLIDSQHCVVHYAPDIGGKAMRWDYLENGKYRYIELPGALQVNNAQSFIAAGLAGVGLIQAPILGLQMHLDRGELQVVLPDTPPEPLSIWFAVAHRNNLSRKVTLFRAWIGELLAPWMLKD
ncbi:LysR family transcriptional regulator [Pluralibacter gergoviae]|uniref:LysR family transcriptional regulator n=1 Tax=Pluralibacter gergoviae TaxID=61647 RepID=UPI0005EC9EA8|nr:LysR family transcriptional regulator [Pluralibacter gergoviae]KJM63368.1 LysR family transcriptional regulator [Pluralibacter gergoviae]OUR04663.1 LysR family transcriptional regulator [Pluralibacter gergoviae]